MNPIEEAEGYEKLIKEFGHTQQSVATMVGKDRSTIANVLRILQLPQPVRKLVEEGQLTAGQARPLLALESEPKITTFARNAVDNGWSAREIESRVREATATTVGKAPSPRGGRPPKADTRPAELKSLEQRLRKHLQTDVAITLKDDKRGSIIIEFYSPDDLDRVSEVLGLPASPR